MLLLLMLLLLLLMLLLVGGGSGGGVVGGGIGGVSVTCLLACLLVGLLVRITFPHPLRITFLQRQLTIGRETTVKNSKNRNKKLWPSLLSVSLLS